MRWWNAISLKYSHLLPNSACSTNVKIFKSGFELCFTTNTKRLGNYSPQFAFLAFKKNILRVSYFERCAVPGLRRRRATVRIAPNHAGDSSARRLSLQVPKQAGAVHFAVGFQICSIVFFLKSSPSSVPCNNHYNRDVLKNMENASASTLICAR